MKPTILTFSGKAGHGKDASVDILLKKINKDKTSGVRISYADYLKFVAKNIYNWNGEKDEEGRSLLQKIGADFRKIDENFWIDNAIKLVEAIGKNYKYILISDCRFENDIVRWKEKGYNVISIKVERNNFDNGLTQEQKNHPSENGLNNFKFDIEIFADSLEELETKLTMNTTIYII